MPRIPDELLDCVVYLYPSEAAAEDGERLGGSGFFLGVSVGAAGQAIVFVVTNKHVVERGSMVVRVNTHDGRTDIIALDHVPWIVHPDGDDIAVCPIGLNSAHYRLKFLTEYSFLIKTTIDEFDVGLGDDVFMIGRFVSHEGKQQNLPSVRFGNIAQMPVEPIVQDDGFRQECFLIEARSIPGYSGSPVFFMLPPQQKAPFEINRELPDDVKKMIPETMKRAGYNPKRALPLQIGPFLVGIDCCHLFNRDRIFSDSTGKPVSDDWHVRSNTGMMGVIPAWKLTEMIERSAMAEIIKDTSVALKRAESASHVALDVAAPPASDENPNHLEDFNRLVDVAARKRPRDDQT